MIFFLCAFALSVTISSFFAALGAWLIFPFAGIEMLALAATLYYCACRASRCEVIRVGEQVITVDTGRHRLERSGQFQRHWARVSLYPAPRRGHPNRLFIRAHGRALEVGRCLVDAERESLARRLTCALTPA